MIVKIYGRDFSKKQFDITHHEYFDLKKNNIEFYENDVHAYVFNISFKSILTRLFCSFNFNVRVVRWFMFSGYEFKNKCFVNFKKRINEGLKNKNTLNYFRINKFKIKKQYLKGYKKI